MTDSPESLPDRPVGVVSCGPSSVDKLRTLTYAIAELGLSLDVSPEELRQCAAVAAMRLEDDNG